MDILQQTLAEEFEKRRTRQIRYSQRRFAKDLGIAPSTLSGLMKNKHGISPDRAEKILTKLAIDEKRTKEILLYVAAEFARSHRERESAKSAISTASENDKYTLIPEDQFADMAEWHHLAIVELSRTKPFRAEPEYIAARLSISIEKAKAAIKTLKKLNLIREIHGRIEPVNANYEVMSRTSAETIRRYHRDLLDKAKESVTNDSHTIREFGSLMFPIDPSELPRARQILRNSWQKIDAELATENPRELYAFNFQFFPISKQPNEN